MPETVETDWAAVRREVMAAVDTRLAICHRHRISLEQLGEHIRSHKWEVPEDATEHDRLLLVRRLFVALERQLNRLMEAVLTGTGDQMPALQRLTATLGKLLELERRVGGNRPERRQSREMQELRARIAKRLAELEVR